MDVDETVAKNYKRKFSAVDSEPESNDEELKKISPLRRSQRVMELSGPSDRAKTLNSSCFHA